MQLNKISIFFSLSFIIVYARKQENIKINFNTSHFCAHIIRAMFYLVGAFGDICWAHISCTIYLRRYLLCISAYLSNIYTTRLLTMWRDAYTRVYFSQPIDYLTHFSIFLLFFSILWFRFFFIIFFFVISFERSRYVDKCEPKIWKRHTRNELITFYR